MKSIFVLVSLLCLVGPACKSSVDKENRSALGNTGAFIGLPEGFALTTVVQLDSGIASYCVAMKDVDAGRHCDRGDPHFLVTFAPTFPQQAEGDIGGNLEETQARLQQRYRSEVYDVLALERFESQLRFEVLIIGERMKQLGVASGPRGQMVVIASENDVESSCGEETLRACFSEIVRGIHFDSRY